MGKKNMGVGGGGGSRDLVQMFAIYGTDQWHTITFLAFHAFVFFAFSLLVLIYLDSFVLYLHSFTFPSTPLPLLRSAAAFSGCAAAILAGCLLYAAGSLLTSSLTLRWDMAHRMLAAVPDWSGVKTALDLGCDRGILLNAVALQLKKQGACGRVVGLDRRRDVAFSALRRAGAEGVQEYVTCREGDARSLPFPDCSFDVVVSAVHISKLGRAGRSTATAAAAAAERVRALGEVVRVLKPGGIGVVWDLVCVPEMAQRLREIKMEEVRVSEKVTAYMVGSHIVSFKKPMIFDSPALLPPEDWRANIC